MSSTDIEILVEDPTAPEADLPQVMSVRAADVVVCLLLLALALTFGFDNWRTGAGWESTGPQSGYFPFYLSIILGGASLYGPGRCVAVAQEASSPRSCACRSRRSCR